MLQVEFFKLVAALFHIAHLGLEYAKAGNVIEFKRSLLCGRTDFEAGLRIAATHRIREHEEFRDFILRGHLLHIAQLRGIKVARTFVSASRQSPRGNRRRRISRGAPQAESRQIVTMQCIKFRACRLLVRNGIHHKYAHGLNHTRRIHVLVAACRNRESVSQEFSLATNRINQAIATRHQNFRNFIVRHIHKNRVAKESVNRSTARNFHREPCDRQARAVKRIHQVIAQEYDFGVAIAIDISDSNAGGFVLQTARATGAALVVFGPFQVSLFIYSRRNRHRSAATDRNHFFLAVTIQIGTGKAEFFTAAAFQFHFGSMQIRRAFRSHIISKSRLAIFGSTVNQIGNISEIAIHAYITLGRSLAFFNIISKDTFCRRIVNFSVNNDGPHHSRINSNRFLCRESSHKTRLH